MTWRGMSWRQAARMRPCRAPPGSGPDTAAPPAVSAASPASAGVADRRVIVSSALIERPGIAGRVMAAGEEIPYCSGDDGCLPPPDDLTRLAGQARRGRPNVPFVGLGHPDTMLTCVHGSWRLGDKVVRLSRRC